MQSEATNKVKIANDVELDFSGLAADTDSRAEPNLTGERDKTPPPSQRPKNTAQNGRESIPAKSLLMQTQREQEDHKRTLEMYKTYQDNIIKSGQLQSDILKGIKAGEDIYILFLKAAEIIGLTTSNAHFPAQIKAELKSIYGEGLLQATPLKLELDETQERLRRLLEARQRELRPDERKRIDNAIKEHEDRIAELEALSKKAKQ